MSTGDKINAYWPIILVIVGFLTVMAIVWMFANDYVALREAQKREASRD